MSSHRERGKKIYPNSVGSSTGEESGHSLEAFAQRLRDLCADDGHGDGESRHDRIRRQAQHALVVAAEFGCLVSPPVSWEQFVALCQADATLLGKPPIIGSEHMIELHSRLRLVGKTTIPPSFGLIPELREIPLAVLDPGSKEPRKRDVIEFHPATPLEYLTRWQASNDIFGDDVRLVSVIKWQDHMVSFGITQPQYHGRAAEPREIEDYFTKAGWKRIPDPSGHVIFFNYNHGVMAIDAEQRNCYINDAGLQPFDVILCEPSEAIERFLRIYPGY